MPEVILPCPACGGNDLGCWEFVVCKDCEMRGPRDVDESAAIAAWNALPRALRWTKETPNVAGKMYLAKGLDLIVYVLKTIEVNGVLYAQFPDGKECRMSYFFEWAGPIPAPIET